MENDETTDTTGTPATPGGNGDVGAQTPPVTPPVNDTLAAPVVPDGYVPATGVETERTARAETVTALRPASPAPLCNVYKRVREGASGACRCQMRP